MIMSNQEHPLPIHNIRIKKLRSLLAIVENSVKGENHLFRNLYAEENGKEVDIFENGHNSCGAHVSWILLVLELIKHPHASSWGTMKDLFESGWYEIDKLMSGAILVWEARKDAMLLGELKPRSIHIGFYVGEDEAISNDSKDTGFPRKHHYTYNGTRSEERRV